MTKDIKVALQNEIKKAEINFLNKAKKEKLLDGTTICVVVIYKDKLLHANVGDSEIVISKNNNAVLLSELHNPFKNQKEVTRVVNSGGKISNNKRVSFFLFDFFFYIYFENIFIALSSCH